MYVRRLYSPCRGRLQPITFRNNFIRVGNRLLDKLMLMPAHILKTFALAALLVAVLPGLADASIDPFDTESSLPPPPGFTQNGESDFQPCRPASTGMSLSLAAVVDAALCANPQTREVWASARVQAAQVGVAKSAYLPSISANAASGRVRSNGINLDQRELGASVSLLLFDFGGRAAALESAQALQAAANATQDATIQSVFLAAVQNYYQVLATQAALDAAKESEKAFLESFKAADARYKAGVATSADKLQAQTAWSQGLLNRIKAEGDVKNAQGALANVIGRDANRTVLIEVANQTNPPDRFEQNVDSLVEQARQRRPDLKAAEAQVRAAAANVDVVKATGRPTLSLGINTSDQHTQGLAEAKTSSIGVTLNIPLFSGFNTHYKIRAAQAQAEIQAAQTEQLRLQVALDVWNTYQSLITATQTVRATVDLLSSAEQSQRVASGRYKAGVGSILDVLNAQSALASARQQRVQSLYSWNVARTALARSMGTLERNTLQEGSAP